MPLLLNRDAEPSVLLQINGRALSDNNAEWRAPAPSCKLPKGRRQEILSLRKRATWRAWGGALVGGSPMYSYNATQLAMARQQAARQQVYLRQSW